MISFVYVSIVVLTSMAIWLNNQSQWPNCYFAKELEEGFSLFYTHTQKHQKSKNLSSLGLMCNSFQHTSWSQWHSMGPLATTSSSKSSSSVFFPWSKAWHYHGQLCWVPTCSAFPQLWDIASSSLTSHLTPTSWAQREGLLSPKLCATCGYVIMQCIERIFKSSTAWKMEHCVVMLQNCILNTSVYFIGLL